MLFSKKHVFIVFFNLPTTRQPGKFSASILPSVLYIMKLAVIHFNVKILFIVFFSYVFPSGLRFKPDIFQPDQKLGQNPDIRIKKKSGFIRIHPDESETDRSTKYDKHQRGSNPSSEPNTPINLRHEVST